MKRVGFVGVPGSVKTSTARALTAYCRQNNFNDIELVSEYARRFITKYGNADTLADQYRVTEKQIEWENSVSTQTDLMVTDSPIFLGFLYALENRNIHSEKDTMYINDLFKRLNKLNINHRYDIIFYLPPILKPIEDGVRQSLHFNDEWREKASNSIKFIFNIFPPKHLVILKEVDISNRVEECLGYMKEFL